MSESLYVLLNTDRYETRVLFELIEKLNPEHSQAQQKVLNYLLTKQKTEEDQKRLVANCELGISLRFSLFCDQANHVDRVTSLEEAKQKKYFVSAEMASTLWGFDFKGYPFGSSMMVEVCFDYPVNFLHDEYKVYRQHCREMIQELAALLGSKMAVYFAEYSELNELKMNEFGPTDVSDVYLEELRQTVENEDDYITRRVEDFYLRAKEIAEPCDWETHYDFEDDDDNSCMYAWEQKAYFVDFFD